MANWYSWAKAVERIVGVPAGELRNTAAIYSRIKNSGLATVSWLELSDINKSNKAKVIRAISDFVKANKPCLFIFDPKHDGLKKGFLFGVNDHSEIKAWMDDHQDELGKYSFLVTSQITNPGDGFVGSVFSDGKGRLFGESLHKPGICNQRELSQPKEDLTKFSDEFLIEDFELMSKKGIFLVYSDIQRLEELYSHRKGYFEFVKGEQHGKKGIFTVGFEPFNGLIRYPLELHQSNPCEITPRINALLMKNRQ